MLSSRIAPLPAFFVTLVMAFAPPAFAQANLDLDAREVVPEFVEMGLRPQVRKLVDRRLLNLHEVEDRYFLEVRFGKIKREQFDMLMGYFGNKSMVGYSAEREYDLVDFLHPAMQAVANKVFTPIYHSLSDRDRNKIDRIQEFDEDEMMFALRKNGLSDSTNCWNTTTEIICNVHQQSVPDNPEYYLYWPGRWEANDWFSEDKYSDSVTERDLRKGDVLTLKMKGFGETSMLQHTAYMLTPNLLFERTDTSENDPYRISLRKDVLSKYRRIFAGDLVVEYRRFGGAGKKSIDPPLLPSDTLSGRHIEVLKKMFRGVDLTCVSFGCESGLGGGCDPMLNVVHRTRVVTDPRTGRGTLSAGRDVLKRFIPLKPN